MDTLIIWKSLIIFLLTYSTFWIIFYTFQPDFLTDEDFVAPGATSRGSSADGTADRSDKYLSDRGRTTLFLYSLIPAFVSSFLYIFLSLYLFRPTEVVCDKGAKSLAECKIMKRKK